MVTDPGSRLDPELLLRHDAFVRGLAHRLVADPQAADDIAQETWVAALSARTGALASVRAWLATLTRRTAARRSRTDGRRVRREQRVADDEPAPSVSELVEREHARAAVVRAVLALPDPFRDVVVLRWFEGLPPRDVARRLGVPVETVRSRHRRALERLRTALDADHDGNRSAWIAMLVPFADVGSPASALPPVGAGAGAGVMSLLGGVLAMSTKIKIGAIAVVALALACWTIYPMVVPPPAPPTDTDATARAQGAALTNQERAIRDTKPAPLREPVNPASTGSRTGSAIVRVSWSDGTPAADVTVLRVGKAPNSFVRLPTGDDGIVAFPALAPGDYRVQIERGLFRQLEQQLMTIEAGQRSELEFTVPLGLTVTGSVVDGEGQPIADAEITATSQVSIDPAPIARTDPDGRFLARDVGIECGIGARATGRAPSLLRELTGSIGSQIDLHFVLDEGAGAVHGRVLDPSGQPVTTGFARLSHSGYKDRLPNGGYGRLPPYRTVRLDADGRFSFDPVLPGELTLNVNADDYVQTDRPVRVAADDSTELTITLRPAASVRGVIRSPGGRPVAGVRVTLEYATDYNDITTSRSDGSFEFRETPSGRLRLAIEGGPGGGIEHVTTAEPGEVVEWHPVVVAAGSIHGRIFDHEGNGVPELRVTASHFAGGRGVWSTRTRTMPDGRFELTNCEHGVPLFLSLRPVGTGFDIASFAAVEPGPREQPFHLPPRSAIRIRGRVVNSTGTPEPNVRVEVFGNPTGMHRTTNAANGTFDLGPYPAGEYRLTCRKDGYAPLHVPSRNIADGLTWDTGPLQLPRGTDLRVTFLADHDLGAASAEVTFPNGEYAWSNDVANGNSIIGPLAPGDYRMHLRSESCVPTIVPFTIREGIDTELTVPVPRGAQVTLRFEPPNETPNALELETTITDLTTGKPRLIRTVWGPEAPELRTTLPPGRYRVTASGPNKLQRILTIDEEIDVRNQPVVSTLQLR